MKLGFLARPRSTPSPLAASNEDSILSRISDAFSSFFSILFRGELPAAVAQRYGYVKAAASKPAAPAAPSKPQAGPADGAVHILSILQRDARLVDFLMEDISGYSDDQVGAAVRDVQAQSRQAMERYLKLQPVIDAVEGEYTKTAGLAADSIKLIGNVPASGKAPGGLLRHKGWRAEKVDLPAMPPGNIIAPAELEIE
jgi:hypothetical protein